MVREASAALNPRAEPTPCKNKKSREGGLSALEGDLRKALGRSFLRWEKDNVKGTNASVCLGIQIVLRKLSQNSPAPFPFADE